MANPIGLRVRNKDNILQIDGKYKNFKLVAQGVITPPATQNQLTSISAPPGYTYTIIAIKCTDAACVPFYNGLGYRLLNAPFPNNSPNRKVEYFIFAETSNDQLAAGIGLRIRNPETGQVIFNSNDRWLKVLGRYSGNMSLSQDIALSYPGKKVAGVQAKRPFQVKAQRVIVQQQEFSSVSSYTGSFFPSSESTMNVRFTPGGSALGPPGPVYEYLDGAAEYFAIDVTGY